MKKFILIFFASAVLTVIMAQPVPEDCKETTTEKGEVRPLQRPTLGQITDRFSSAVRLTIKDERAAISRAVQEVTDAIRQFYRAGGSAAKAGIQMMLFMPELSRTILIDTKTLDEEIARPN